MEDIMILSCISCQKIADQWTMIPKCTRCGTNRWRQLQPTRYVLAKWFLTSPLHVVKLLIQDLREKRHEKGN